jgi:hypothetical protein
MEATSGCFEAGAGRPFVRSVRDCRSAWRADRRRADFDCRQDVAADAEARTGLRACGRNPEWCRTGQAVVAFNERSLSDLPQDGERKFFRGSLEDPKGYWATYSATTNSWERDG